MEMGLIEILKDWNFWGNNKLSVGSERKRYVEKILKLLSGKNNIISEVGVRRCGKSFIARQVLARMIKGGVQKNNTLIIDLNDERYLQRDYKLFLEIYETYKKNLKPKGQKVIVIDEPQEIKGWERFVRGLSEREDAKFIVTGSSSKLLSSEFSTLLSGRQITVTITPLSFKEFLGIEKIKSGTLLEIDKNSAAIKEAFDRYLKFGGFPAVVMSTDKNAVLSSYFDTILVKDIAERYGLRDASKLKFLSKFYLTNIASQISYNSISKSTALEGRKGLPVKTIERYSNYLESSYLLFFVKRFSFSFKEQENSPRKVYAIDNGFVTAMSFNFMEIKGRLLENLVAVELLRRSHETGNMEIYYWKSKTSKKEVDFVVKYDKKVLPIQITYEINKDSERREIDGLLEAMKNLHVKKGMILTYDQDKLEKTGDIEIEFIPVWKWILNAEL